MSDMPAPPVQIEVVRRRAGGVRLFDLTSSERRHFASDLIQAGDAGGRGLGLGKSRVRARAELVGPLVGLVELVDRAARVPAAPPPIASHATAAALSFPAVTAVLAGAKESNVAAAYSARPIRLIGSLPRGAAVLAPRKSGFTPRRAAPGVVVKVRRLVYNAALVSAPWRSSPLAPEFSLQHGLVPGTSAVLARAANGISAADSVALFPPPSPDDKKPKPAEDQTFAVSRLAHAAAVGLASLGRVLLVCAIGRRALAPNFTTIKPDSKTDSKPSTSWVADVDPLPALSDWRAILGWRSAARVPTESEIYAAAGNDPRIAAAADAARESGGGGDEFAAAAALLFREREAADRGAAADRARVAEIHSASTMKRLLASRRPREFEKHRIALDAVNTPAGVERVLGAEAFARLEREHAIDAAYWESRVSNPCPHVRLYDRARGSAAAARFVPAFRDLARMLEPRFAEVRDRWVSCTSCEFPAVCPHALALFRARAEGTDDIETEERLRPFFRENLPPAGGNAVVSMPKNQRVCKICSEVVPVDRFDADALDSDTANSGNETEERVRVELRNAAGHVHSSRGIVSAQSIVESGMRPVAALYSRALAIIRRDRGASDRERDDRARTTLGLYVYAYIAAAVLSAKDLRLEGEHSGKGSSRNRSASVLTTALRLYVRRFLVSTGAAEDSASIKKRFLEAFRALGSVKAEVRAADPTELLAWRLSISPAFRLLRLARWLASPGKFRGAAEMPIAAVLGAPLADFLPSGNRAPKLQLFADVKLPHGKIDLAGDKDEVLRGAAYTWRALTVVPGLPLAEDRDGGAYPFPYPLAGSGAFSDTPAPGDVSAVLDVGPRQLGVQNGTFVNGPPGFQYRPNVVPPLGVGHAPNSSYNFSLLYWTNGARQEFDVAVYSPSQTSAKGDPIVVRAGDFATRAKVPAGWKFDWFSTAADVSLRAAREAGPADIAASRKLYNEREKVRDFYNFYQNRCPVDGVHEYKQHQHHRKPGKPEFLRQSNPVCIKCDTPSDAQDTMKTARAVPAKLRRIFDKFRRQFDSETVEVSVSTPPAASLAAYSVSAAEMKKMRERVGKWQFDSSAVTKWARAVDIKPRMLMLLGMYSGLTARDVAGGAAGEPSFGAAAFVNSLVYEVHAQWELFRRASLLPKLPPFLVALGSALSGSQSSTSARTAFAGLGKLPPLDIGDYAARYHAARAELRADADIDGAARLRDWCLEELALLMLRLAGAGTGAQKKTVDAFVSALSQRFVASAKTSMAFETSFSNDVSEADGDIDSSAVEAASEFGSLEAADGSGLAAGEGVDADEDLGADYEDLNEEDGRLYSDE